MIRISNTLSISDHEFEESFIHASGPGGQNVNKVSSAVQLRFNIATAAALTDEIRLRLIALAGRRANQHGILIIDSQRYRTQARNRADARLRLAELIRKAIKAPTQRLATKPTRLSQHRRLENKHRHSIVKTLRRSAAAE